MRDFITLLGAVAAGILSWQKWHSLGWLIFHVLLGWGYVAYYFAFRVGKHA
jgi:hypothetical protein